MTLTNTMRILAGAFLLFSTASASPQGIAFAYAPERGSGVCTGENAGETLECARNNCVEQSGASPDDCAQMTWCANAGWSVGVGIMHKEGIHWSEFSCGWPTQESALAAGAILCDAEHREFIAECTVGMLWNKVGQEFPMDSDE